MKQNFKPRCITVSDKQWALVKKYAKKRGIHLTEAVRELIQASLTDSDVSTTIAKTN